MIKAVIFDLDDTLISERQYIESGYRHIAKFLSLKLNKNKDELFKHLMTLFNNSPKNVFNRLLDELGIEYTKNDILELVEQYRNHLPAIDFFDDVMPCIEDLKKNKIKLGIITDGYAITQQKKLRVLNAYHYFDEIIVTDELGREYWKPHPRAFEIMKQKLNIAFDQMIYVGDNPKKDFYISSVYPIKTIRIIRNNSIYKNELYYKNIKEMFTITSLLEINKIFKVV